MYPYKITWTAEYLNELYEDKSYGYVYDLTEIQNMIRNYISEFMFEYDDKISNEIKHHGTTTLGMFYEIVNQKAHYDFIFLKVKYFDSLSKSWKDYEVDEQNLNEYFCDKLRLFTLTH